MGGLTMYRITIVDWNGHVLTTQIGDKKGAAFARFYRDQDQEGIRYAGLFDPEGKAVAEYFRDWATHAHERGWRAQ